MRRLLRLIFPAIIFFVAGCLFAVDKDLGEVSIREYLEILGNKYDIYFTAELFGKTKTKAAHNRKFVFVVADHNLDTQMKLLPQEASLKLSLETICERAGLKFESSPTNPRVIHVFDSRLDNDEYPMKTVIPEFTFSEVAAGLPSALTKLGFNVEAEVPSGTPVIAVNDNVSKLYIHAKNVTVRDVLTNYLPFSRYNRILWETLYNPEKKSVTVLFNRRGDPTQVYNHPANVNAGRPRFEMLVKAHKPDVAEAVNAIESGNPESPTDQTRWAMLLLGEFRAGEGVATLVRHLRYQYAPVEDIAESYPATAALIRIGEPATDHLLKAAVAAKDDMLFQRLAAYTLVGIWKERALNIIDTVSSNAPRLRVEAEKFLRDVAK
ncbi:MAG: hypothetical protein NTW87_10520 [Planctomycetota bacterium]|nr:hypothetical protein [Planctomycetota bacterium]